MKDLTLRVAKKRVARKPKRQAKDNGRLLYQDQHRIVIGTGFAKSSANKKTGDMIQIWILVKEVNPYEAVKTGLDRLICGDCEALKSATLARRNAGIKAKDDPQHGCYVILMHGPAPIWKAYKRGAYRKLESTELFRGRFVRFGAYGDPSFMPFDLVRDIASVASGFTGYTHRWHKPLVQRYSDYFCASTNAGNREQAQAMGWRTFTVSDVQTGNDFLCPASKEFEQQRRASNKPLANGAWRSSCEQCGLCKGNSTQARSTYIPAH